MLLKSPCGDRNTVHCVCTMGENIKIIYVEVHSIVVFLYIIFPLFFYFSSVLCMNMLYACAVCIKCFF